MEIPARPRDPNRLGIEFPGGRTLRRRRTVGGPRPLALLAAGLAVAALALGAGYWIGSRVAELSETPPPAPVHLYLTVAFNPETGLDEYFPANFTVPARTEVLVTIANYDNGTNLVEAADAAVRGTVGGTVTIVNASHPGGQAVAGLPVDGVSHTFTLDSAPYDLNVPIPPSESTAVPALVTFATYFNATGSFTWHCMAPCDPVSMDTLGFMRGTVTVVEA